MYAVTPFAVQSKTFSPDNPLRGHYLFLLFLTVFSYFCEGLSVLKGV